MHRLFLHADDCDPNTDKALSRRLNLVLHQMAAHGRPSVAKACSDAVNRGWRRTPMGGNNGSHYYLWWAPQGTGQVQDDGFPAGSLVVRAIRHHDDHRPLLAGGAGDYYEFKTGPELADAQLLESPWTEEQRWFAQSPDHVRIILGPPGSGKTSALWNAARMDGPGRVLYLTWSEELARRAREYFAAFAPGDHVVVRDYSAFLGELCGRDVPRPPADARLRFLQRVRRLDRAVRGPWTEFEEGLFAEVRGVLLGGIHPGSAPVEGGGMMRMSDGDYRRKRGAGGRLDAQAIASLLHSVQAIEKRVAEADPEYPAFPYFFPELSAAWEAARGLKERGIPPVFGAGFERVVVDEVQDLSLLEVSVILEFCRANETLPKLLVAGDEGQTVRPSCFEWAAFKGLLTHAGFQRPRELVLRENLRSPVRIARVLEQVSAFYDELARSHRPRWQCAAEKQCMEARLFHVHCSRSEAVRALRGLSEGGGVVTVTPGETLPGWIPEDLAVSVLTPAQAKGLEYQTVCVLDPGPALVELQAVLGRRAVSGADLTAHDARGRIDQLRVALSRAVEALVFLDTVSDPDALGLSTKILGDAAPFTVDDLLEELSAAGRDPEADVDARCENALRLIDEKPGRSWQLVRQAVRKLGDPSLPLAVADPATRRRAHSAWLAVGARLLLSSSSPVPRDEILGEAPDVLARIGGEPPLSGTEPGDRRVFEALGAWAGDRTQSPCALLELAASPGAHRDWVPGVLSGVGQELRQGLERAAQDPRGAATFGGNVEGWLELTGFIPGTEALNGEVVRLRSLAVETLLDHRHCDDAEQIVVRLTGGHPQFTARLSELRGFHREAAVVYAGLGLRADALRNWRAAGCWEAARELASGPEAEFLEWLQTVSEVLATRPGGVMLTVGERERLEQAWRRAVSGAEE